MTVFEKVSSSSLELLVTKVNLKIDLWNLLMLYFNTNFIGSMKFAIFLDKRVNSWHSMISSIKEKAML